MNDTPETDLEDDLSIDCDNPCYNCPVVKASTGEHLTCDFVPAEFARRLERERDEARRDAATWKSNHDNQVELKSIISKRGDLKDRAPRVEKLIAERDQLRDAVKWALGESGGFGPRPKGVGAYWWRKDLRKRAGISEPNKTTKNE
jgi:hypothetical protein